VLIVVANCADSIARDLVRQWAGDGARLLTPADLSTVGWRDYAGGNREVRSPDMAVVDGTPVPVEDIRAVLTRLPAVFENEVGGIMPEDRAYVAAEMTAFLLSWLSSLRCPVLNRPSSLGLCGPTWRLERWVLTAARIGIPVRPVRRRPDPPGYFLGEGDWDVVTLSVVGERVLGEAAPILLNRARSLAREAGAELLAVRFDGPHADARFLSADVWPDLGRTEVADAVLEYLLRSRGPARPGRP
jgi:hypothetical protein